MNFRKATDALLANVTLEDLAGALGVSVQAVRQARASEDTTSFRKPPLGWEKAVAYVAERRARDLQRLTTKLTGG
jgi:hypothetical protein